MLFNIRTAVMSAGHLQFLIEHGADVRIVKNNGWTALHLAARYGHTGMAVVSFSRLKTDRQWLLCTHTRY